MKIKRFSFLILFLFFTTTAYSQNDYKAEDIEYKFSIPDTPYGDYFGELILFRDEKYKRGILLDQDSLVSPVKVLKFKNEELIFRASIEETNVKFKCILPVDSVKCTVNIKGDDFTYFLKGIRKENENTHN